jgi:hypothetical protein
VGAGACVGGCCGDCVCGHDVAWIEPGARVGRSAGANFHLAAY